MSHDTPLLYEQLNRHGRRTQAAMSRKGTQFNRNYNAREHAKLQAKHRREGLAYRIAKIKGDWSAIRLFQRMHPKLRKQFNEENRRLKARA
jgi:hypothetical protein